MILFGPNFWWLFFGTLLVAVGNGIVEAVINPAVASLFKTGKTKWLNILHAGWAGGILLGSLVAIFLGDAPWRLKVGLIFVPMLIYGFMLLRAVFPASERVLAGVSYREMLREMGVVGFALVIFLVTKEVMNIFANLGWAFVGWEDTKMLAFALIPTIVLIIPIGAYVRSPGRPLFLILLALMFPLATTELATDAWIKELMTPVVEGTFHIDGGWVLVYSAFIMMVLRFNAGAIATRIGPLGLMVVSSLFAAAGLFFMGSAVSVWIIFAATVYAIGQSFFWPTTLGIVAERFPRGGALTLNAISAVGMLGVGILGTPFLGLLQDKNINAELKQQDPAAYETVIAAEKQSIYGKYQALDPAKVEQLKSKVPEKEETIDELRTDMTALISQMDSLKTLDTKDAKAKVEELQETAEQKSARIEELAQEREKTSERISLIQRIKDNAKRYALRMVAIVPFIMGVCYIILILWFRSRGGYKTVHITSEEAKS
ncbi:MAG: MFS transporter [Chitinivibrionales bacterium]|nr:MFS transporter [Chitinivibrionales bacterium]